MVKDKEEIHDVEDIELIEEAYDRVDVLVELLEKKGLLTKEEFEASLSKFLDKKYD